jgi:hypothetical protein
MSNYTLKYQSPSLSSTNKKARLVFYSKRAKQTTLQTIYVGWEFSGVTTCHCVPENHHPYPSSEKY